MSAEVKHPIWGKRCAELEESCSEVELAILVLGSGQGSSGYNKRLEIKAHLNQVSNKFDATFSEEIEGAIAVPEGNHMTNIRLHTSLANVIFALLIDDPRVSGVLTELNKFDDYPRFREKTYLIVPKRRRSIRRNDCVPLIWQTVDKFPQTHILDYSAEEFESCDNIRNYVEDIAKRVAKKNVYQTFVEKSGMSLPIS